MNDRELPDSDHVVRYAGFTDILDDGTLNCSAFQLRKDEAGLSVYWLECFEDRTKAQQLEEIRPLIRLKLGRKAGLAELNVGKTREHIGNRLDELRFINVPLSANEKLKADPSHSEIMGLPPKDSPEAELIGDMIAECVVTLHPAKI